MAASMAMRWQCVLHLLRWHNYMRASYEVGAVAETPYKAEAWPVGPRGRVIESPPKRGSGDEQSHEQQHITSKRNPTIARLTYGSISSGSNGWGKGGCVSLEAVTSIRCCMRTDFVDEEYPSVAK